jgi:DNA-binding beta-propeller fold protein YncE
LNDLNGLVSHDGRWIVFEGKTKPGASDRDVLVVPSAGGAPQPLLAGPSEEDAVAFTPDGRYLLYRSNTRAFETGTYAVRFTDGKVSGEPVLISTTLPSRRGYFDRNGNYYYALQTGGEAQPHVVDFDQATGKVTAAVKPVPLSHGSGEGRTNWAGDSKTVILHRFGKGRMIEAAIADVDTGREVHTLQTDLPVAFGAFLQRGSGHPSCGLCQP